MIKKLSILTVICIVVTATIFFLKMNTAADLLFACKTVNISSDCVLKQVHHVAQELPDEGAKALEQLAKLKRYKLIQGDFRDFSNTLHHLGSIFYKQEISGDSIASICPALIKDGCIHGYVMEFINSTDIYSGIELCKNNYDERRVYYGCWHAVGHSYGQQSVQQQTLADILDESPCLNEGLERNACLAGVFHEEARHGLHTDHATYYDRTVGVNFDPSCSDVSEDFKVICLLSRASFSQYNSDSNINLGLEICNYLESAEEYGLCLQLLKERKLIGKGYAFLP